MMSLKERIDAAISQHPEILNDPEFIRLRDFYEDMKAKGAVIKKVYEFPARDTWGPPARKHLAEDLRVSSDGI
jgi:hypothetical protein